jgi:hypothetical protein
MKIADGAHFKTTRHAIHRIKERAIDLNLIETALTSAKNIYDIESKDGIIHVVCMIDEEIFVVVLKKVSEASYIIITVFPTETPPDYLRINIYRARNLIQYDVAAAIILGVSAFEAFCSDYFAAIGDFEKYLVDSRRISFQQLDVANNIFKIRMNLDLASDTASWETLNQIFKVRHILIHRGGVQKDGTLVRVTKQLAKQGLDAIEAIIQKIETFKP